MIMSYRYVSVRGWAEDNKPKHNDMYILGNKVEKLLKNKEQVTELFLLLHDKCNMNYVESMDIYFDESNKEIFMTVKLFDEENDLVDIFNVTHSVQRQEFLLLLEFLEFGFEHDVNVYYFKGRVADDLNEYVKDCYEIGYKTVKIVKPIR